MRKRTFVAPFVITIGCGGSSSGGHVESSPTAELEKFVPPSDEALAPDAAVPLPDAGPPPGTPMCRVRVMANPPYWREEPCPPPDAGPNDAWGQVIGAEAGGDGLVVITVAAGTEQGVAAGWRGRLHRSRKGPAIPGSDFVVSSVLGRSCKAKVKLTMDQVRGTVARLAP